MASGQTFGQMIDWAITALSGIDHTDSTWGNAAALFDNRMEVSRYYSIEKAGTATSLATLQQILTGITSDVATVATAKAAVDNLLSNPTFNLADLNGSNGFRLDGVAGSDDTGEVVGSAGDINGDGFDDLIIGAPHNFDDFYSGSSFVVFGKASGFSATLPLSSLDGSNGFRINGVAGGDAAGQAVGSAGDINGDGFDDLLIGAPISDNPKQDTGHVYVVFGKAAGFSATIDLSSLDGTNGFQMSVDEGDVLLAWFLDSAGDVNGDHIDDFITVDLSGLDGSNGFTLEGEAEGDEAGYSVDNAGDVNGDGFDDVIIGARSAGINGEGSGAAYVVFGKASGFDVTLNLSSLDGSNGFRLEGVAAGEQAGRSVSTAGDFNGDGFDDVIVGSYAADANGIDSGSAYVVFGKASGFSASLNLSNLNSTDGFSLSGLAAGNSLGKAVSSAGDINNDGFDDLIVGAPFATGGTFNSGVGYVIFGHSLASTAAASKTIETDSLDVNSQNTTALLVGVNLSTDLI